MRCVTVRCFVNFSVFGPLNLFVALHNRVYLRFGEFKVLVVVLLVKKLLLPCDCHFILFYLTKLFNKPLMFGTYVSYVYFLDYFYNARCGYLSIVIV